MTDEQNNQNSEKTLPTHRLVFSAQRTDQQGVVHQSPPTQVGAVWARKNGKQGGILEWDISAQTLGEGEYHLRENRQPGQAFDASVPPKSYRIAYSEKQAGQPGAPKVGRPVEVAGVNESGKVAWGIGPERLNNGVFFVLENDRAQTQSAPKHAQAFAQIEAKKPALHQEQER